MNRTCLRFARVLTTPLFVLFAAPIAATAASQAPRPNILLILADDLGYGDLGCYGQELIATPHLDRLAAEGTRFTNCYAGSTVCSPSRGTLMTGFHTGHGRIRGNMARAGGILGRKGNTPVRRVNLAPEDVTVAEVLRDAGYATGLVNKWHMDGFNPEAGPLDNGFEFFRGWLVSQANSNSPYYFPARRFHGRELIAIEANADGARARHNTDISTDDAIDFLETDRDRPFFLFLSYDAPHEPFIVADHGPYADRAWTDKQKAYAMLVTQMDAAIGRLLAKLDEFGQRENTIVFFASDNGGARLAPLEHFNSNGGLRGYKVNLYEGGIRVPMIVRWPGRVPAARTNDAAWYFPDLLPTFAALAGAEAPAGIDGINVLPLILGETDTLPDRYLYWEFPELEFTQAVRWREWKAIRAGGIDQPLELYNLAQDPGETSNVAAANPDLVARFETFLREARTESENWPLSAPPPPDLY